MPKNTNIKYAVSDTFIIIISERAKRVSASGNDLYFHASESILRGELRESEGQRKFAFGARKTVSDAYLGQR